MIYFNVVGFHGIWYCRVAPGYFGTNTCPFFFTTTIVVQVLCVQIQSTASFCPLT